VVTKAAGRAALLLQERAELPTAVIANNDHAAFGLMISLIRAGIPVPGTISITGYDDSRIAQLPFIDLTSVRQDPAEIGDLAVESAISRISGERRPVERITSANLVVRTSTAPPLPR
jgi:DNA-binding LacI/PurR family transcriptional regulator